MTETIKIFVLDVSHMSYAEQVTAACLQGLANRDQPRLFLDYGIYDDPESRKTNQDALGEDLWVSKFRDAMGRQDEHNLNAYQKLYPIHVTKLNDLSSAVHQFQDLCRGFVVWDPQQEDTVNLAVMFCSVENWLPVAPDLVEWSKQFGLKIEKDLRGCWQDHVALHAWAHEQLFARCRPDRVANIEPHWHRPELLDYVVKEKIFTCNLSSKGSGRAFNFGWKLLTLCLGGPTWLRNALYNVGLFRWVKNFALQKMSSDPETGLLISLLRKVARHPEGIIFGWHTNRDDEFAFLALLSAIGLRLVPSHLAANFSFHSALPDPGPLKQFHVSEADVALEPEKDYLTFTYSDGDQLLLMSTAQLGGWRRKERGLVPFNWEMQPLLAELAPALLGLFYSTLTPNDCLIAGPSGAGYIIPPLHDNLPEYLRRSAEVCAKADINVITSYYPDPPSKVIQQHLQAPDNLIGYLSGYFYLKHRPVKFGHNKVFLCNLWPHLSQIKDSSDEMMAGVKKILDTPSSTPRFIGVHLFAYCTTVSDVYDFVRTLDPSKVKVVRADEFLLAAKKYSLQSK